MRAVSLRAVAERILARELGSVAAEVSAAAGGGRLQAARLGLARLQRHAELAEVWSQLDEVPDGAPLRIVRHAHDAGRRRAGRLSTRGGARKEGEDHELRVSQQQQQRRRQQRRDG